MVYWCITLNLLDVYKIMKIIVLLLQAVLFWTIALENVVLRQTQGISYSLHASIDTVVFFALAYGLPFFLLRAQTLMSKS